MDGWIKLHRKLLDWEWIDDHNTTRLFLFLLLTANHKETKWRGEVIKEGQVLTGRNQLSQKTGISPQSIRTSLERLKSTSEVTIKSTSQFSIITLNKWKDYQDKSTNESTSNLTSVQPASNQQVTTSNNVKNDKNVKNKRKINKKKKSNSIILSKNQTARLSESFPGVNIKAELRIANDYLKAEGLEKNDYLAWFRNWLRRKSQEKSPEVLKAEKQEQKRKQEIADKFTPDQIAQNLKRLQDMKRGGKWINP